MPEEIELSEEEEAALERAWAELDRQILPQLQPPQQPLTSPETPPVLQPPA
jgi:hypothetical protein